MMDDNALFIDTNILVYANVIETPLHAKALAAINGAAREGRVIWINRQVIREYLVTLTRPQAFQNLPREVVFDQVRQFSDYFEVADDTSAVSNQLMQLLADYSLGGKQIHDANIVATMQVYGISALLTHNVKDFRRFDGLVEIEQI